MASKSKGGKGKYRSAITGRYVTKSHGRRSPRTTVKESASSGSKGKSASSKGKYRSAITGRYVTAAHGKRSPRTTVKESD